MGCVIHVVADLTLRNKVWLLLLMLAIHILTHTFQHTLFDWLKVTWVPPNHVGPI